MADSVERLAKRAAEIRLDDASPPPSPVDLEIMIPNPFERRDDEGQGADDAEMPTASPRRGSKEGRIAAAPALPQPPIYSGRTMQDRRDFMHNYEGYLVKVNALQTEWIAALAMPIGACIETNTRRRIARWEFDGASPETITEDEWKGYFRQALVPTFVDYASIDVAMKSLKMQTKWPEPESRMMHLQADMEAILNRFNVTDLAFKHEQRRLVGYLTKALEPGSFREVVAAKMTLQEFKPLKNDAIGFCRYVVELMRGFMTWEHAAEAAARSSTTNAGGHSGGCTNAMDVALDVVAVAKQPLDSLVLLAKEVATIPIGSLAAATPADVVVLVDVAKAEPEVHLAAKEGLTTWHDLAAPALNAARHSIKSWAARIPNRAKQNTCWQNCARGVRLPQRQ